MDEKRDLFLKVHGVRLLNQDSFSIEIEGVVLVGNQTVPGKTVEISLNDKTHRIATMENGRLRAELVFPAGSQPVQHLHAKVATAGLEPEAIGTECTVDIYRPGSTDTPSDTTRAPGFQTDLPLPDILAGKRPVRQGELLRLPKDSYEITGDLQVNKGGKIVVEPGCTVEFSTDAGIICEGVIEALGNEWEKIIFRARQSRWRNILLYGRETSGSRFKFCYIEHGHGRALRVDSMRNIVMPVIEKESTDGSNGGGLQMIYTYNADIVLENVTVCDNLAHSGKGGGIFLLDSSPIIRQSEMAQNQATLSGGGIYIEGIGSYDTKLLDSTIAANKTQQDGGGIYLNGVSPHMEKLNVRYNEASFGGAIYHNTVSPDNLKIINCTIDENVSFVTPDDSEGICGEWTEPSD